MNENLNNLNVLLSVYEKKLEHAYVEYAKKVDDITSIEMKTINVYVDRIVQIKKEIKELENPEKI
ncbi:hypothetical protein H9L01_04525 [Erysipelothrix inopinata]|uniref:Uncharacterized protein n=1 Tax=Erysipelothrix inopinata TaxID=225084 RepID=A0A7G9S199_9FIRM|nr:hypothetical protein [Erysipelothrix inopinata]QNN61624.1 hypothetical protein H9L01_04525 [Erysipelothrix inopinata]